MPGSVILEVFRAAGTGGGLRETLRTTDRFHDWISAGKSLLLQQLLLRWRLLQSFLLLLIVAVLTLVSTLKLNFLEIVIVFSVLNALR